MWRFSLRLADAANCSRPGLLTASVTEDFDFSSAVRAFHNGEVVFVVNDNKVVNVAEAQRFVRDLCGSVPTRIWFDGKEVNCT
jgi:hypothetical protein